ncbi:MAG: protein kinase domain-containing protein, partial [Planctomycetota bacterium]
MPEDTDSILGRLAIKRGFLTQEQLDEALATQRKARDEMGLDMPLLQVLQNKHLLTPDQAQDLRHAVAVETGEARLVAGYEVVSKLGQGGFGVVYKAKQAATGQFVALKILPPSLASEDLIARFQRESETVRDLDHDNIVSCVEFGYDPKRKCHFCALELVEGEDLAKRIAHVGVLSETEALSITRQVAMALQHAYFNGLVHRDVKPENIMVTPDGTAKLLDLGLARPANAEASRLTQTGMFVGSAYYASPEQAKSESGIDTRSDIYSLGATLYHMVTGKPPFQGSNVAHILYQQAYEKLVWPAEVNPELSDGVCRVIAKMLAKAPDDRYQTPNDLLRDIDTLEEGGEPEVADAALRNSSVRMPAVRPKSKKKRKRPPSGPRHARAREAGHADGRRRRARDDAPAAAGMSPMTKMWAMLGVGAAVFLVGLVALLTREEPKRRPPALPLPDAADADGDTLPADARDRSAQPDSPGYGPSPIDTRKVSPGDIPMRVPADAVKFGGHFYKLYDQKLSWHDAKAFCEKRGGHLVTITSKEENDFVTGLARKADTDAWIGLTDERAEGKWEWVTGEKVAFRRWAGNEPSNFKGEQHYVLIYRAGDFAWDDERPNGMQNKGPTPFVCEWKPGGGATVARPPPVVTKPGPPSKPGVSDFDARMLAAVRALDPAWEVRDYGARDRHFLGVIRSYRGRIDVVATHPAGQGTPCTLEQTRKIPAGGKTELLVTATNDPRGGGSAKADWELRVFVDSKRIAKRTIGHGDWRSHRFDLSAYAGKTIKLAIQNANGGATSWTFEGAIWAEARVVTEGEAPAAEPPKTLTLDLGGGVEMELIYIKPGVFVMGGNENPREAWQGVEKPKHEVAITNGFHLGKHEVTQAQYERIMGSNPSKSKGASNPVEQVSWNDAAEFCRKLSRHAGRKVRLPTEAEWEYACRAGTTSKWCFGSDQRQFGAFAWHDANSGKRTHPVGGKRANAWGLHDVHGNVWEWVSDRYGKDYYAKAPRVDPGGPATGTARVLRGGGWYSGHRICRSAFRNSAPAITVDDSVGFRVAASASAQASPAEPDGAVEITRGLLGEYYAGGYAIRNKLLLRRIDPQVDFDWPGSPAPRMPKDHFSVRWKGTIVPPATGDYVFHLSADDKGRLWVDGRPLVSASHKNPGVSGPVGLQAGKAVPVRLEVVEGMWGAGIHFLWTGPGIPTPVPVPTECLRPPDAAAAAAAAGLSRGLLGWWKLDETAGATAYDSSGNGNHGTVKGGAKWAKGKIGGGFEFDGRAAIVQVPDAKALRPQQLTVAAWVKLHCPLTDMPERFPEIVHKNSYAAGTGFVLGVLDDKSKLGLRVHGGARRDVSSLDIGAGEWCHLAAVYDGEVVALYRNGGTPHTDAGKGVVLKHDSTPLSIGKGFQGLIDDVRI